MKKIPEDELRDFLEEKTLQYNRPEFILSDPVSIPHRFTKKHDIEIAGFLAATIAWGQRKTILKNAANLLERMDQAPYDFVMTAQKKELKQLQGFVHRTFNSDDLIYFIRSLQRIYKRGGLQKAFNISEPAGITSAENKSNLTFNAIVNFRSEFLKSDPTNRAAKHVSDPSRNSSAKRLCMFLRWMVRKDACGVDFGCWNTAEFNSSHLMCPLDVHSGNVSRKLGLLQRRQNDWKAVIELTEALRRLDPFDPVKYDLALFGLGVFEKF